MGKKHDKKGKKKIVLSLAEFNDEGRAVVQTDIQLPTAPRGQEEWDASGGRPEYNSRGYKARPQKEQTYDEDLPEHDWSRRGPMEGRGGEGQPGAGLGERNWGTSRHGPTEAEDGAQPERNWDSGRRGPMEVAAEGSAAQRNWGARRGPTEADGGPREIGDDQWGSARHSAGGVEADIPQGRDSGPRDWTARNPVEADIAPVNREDWTARKGPVEAEVVESAQKDDWTMRRGPVESDIPAPSEERNWMARKGPVEAEAPKTSLQSNWGDVRRDSAEAEATPPQHVDWAKRKGPMEEQVEEVQKGVREVDFGYMRSGAKLQKFRNVNGGVHAETVQVEETPRTEAPGGNWRRDSVGSTGKQPRVEARSSERPASTGHDGVAKERDWGSARRGVGVKHSRPSRPQSGRRFPAPREPEVTVEAVSEEVRDISDVTDVTDVTEEIAQDGDWTTVRTVNRRSVNRRSSKGAQESLVATEPTAPKDHMAPKEATVGVEQQ